MRWNGKWVTPNGRFQFTIVTPREGVQMISTVAMVCPLGHLELQRTLYTAKDVQKAMLDLATPFGVEKDASILAIVGAIGEMK